MFNVLYFAAIVIGLVFGAALVGMVTKDKLTKKRLGEIIGELADEGVSASGLALFAGRRSQGEGQSPAAGALILSSERLVFETAMPRRRLAIPTELIVSAQEARAQGAKESMLQVNFRDQAAGIEDSAIWAVPNAGNWVSKVTMARMSGGAVDGIEPWGSGD